MVVALYVICCFSFVAFIILALSSFDRWTFVDKVMGGSEPSQQCEDILVLMFSSLWVTHPAGMGFDFVVICPSYLLAVASSFSLDMEYLFLVGSRVLLSMVVQQLVVILVLLQKARGGGGVEHTSFYSAIFYQNPLPEPFCRHKKTGMHLTYHISSNLLATNRHLQRVLKDGMRNENVKAQVFDGEGELRKRRQIKQSLDG